MAWVDRNHGIRTELQALYGVGLVLGSFAAADALGGDGFLAAFAAGFAVTYLNLDLCDCFLEYGEVTAEMAMLLSFVLFGAIISDLASTLELWETLLFAGCGDWGRTSDLDACGARKSADLQRRARIHLLVRPSRPQLSVTRAAGRSRLRLAGPRRSWRL